MKGTIARRALSAVTILALIISLFAWTAATAPAYVAAEGATFSVGSKPDVTFETLEEAITTAGAIDTITLTGIYTLNTGVKIPEGSTLTLQGADSNSKIIRGSLFTSPMIQVGDAGATVNSVASLTLSSIIIDGGYDETEDTKTEYPIIHLNRYGTPSLIIENGAILQNNYNKATSANPSNAGRSGGAVNAYNGFVTINGGIIRNNTSMLGAVGSNSAVITMNGGSVINNAGLSDGGGFFIYNATLHLNGGTVFGNKAAAGKNGDDVYLRDTSNTKCYVGAGTDVRGEIYSHIGASNNSRPPLYAKSSLSNVLPVDRGTAAKEGHMVMAGDGYTLTQADAKKLDWAGEGIWYFKLDEDSNQILLTATDPGYGGNDPGSSKDAVYTGDNYTATGHALYGGEITVSDDTGIFTVSANTENGYVIDEIIVDGLPLENVRGEEEATYTFPTETTGEAHSIVAAFAYTVNFNTPANGALSVSRVVGGNAVGIERGEIVRGGEVLRISAGGDNVFTSLVINGESITEAEGTGAYDYTVGTRGATRDLGGGKTATVKGADIRAETASAAPPVLYKIHQGFRTVGNGHLIFSPAIEVAAGTPVTVTAVPDDGYELVPGSVAIDHGGINDEPCQATDDPFVYTFIMPAYETYIIAQFQLPVNGEDAPEQAEDGYYLLGGTEDIQWLSDTVLSGTSNFNVRLTDDIDMSVLEDFIPIGYEVYERWPGESTQLLERFHPYMGTFDGAGHTINIDLGATGHRSGLFAEIGAGGVVKDLTVTGAINAGPYSDPNGGRLVESSSDSGIGGISGMGGSFYNCKFSGTISRDLSSIPTGGIVGRDAFVVENCESDGVFNGACGIAGSLVGGGIAVDCVNRAEITNHGAGIVGTVNTGASVINCINYGDVIGSGGIAGGVGQRAVVTDCVNYGDVSGQYAVDGIAGNQGGIAGAVSIGTVTNCVNYGDVSGSYAVGGVVGMINNAGTVLYNVNLGKVTITSSAGSNQISDGVGGIVGSVPSNGNVTDNYNGGAVIALESEGESSAGGVIGRFTGSYSDNTGLHEGSARRNYSSGTVSVPGGIVAGPVVGIYNAANEGLISDNYHAASAIADYEGPGEAVNGANASYVAAMLADILTAAGMSDEIKYNEGGYPVPESLWDGFEGEEPEAPVVPIEFRLAFNVTPEYAVVELRDAGDAAVSPLEAGGKVYIIPQGSYAYTISAPGYIDKSATVFLGASRTITEGLLPEDPEYEAGHAGARPSFGVYIMNRDGATGTRIGNWDYDETLFTYVDGEGKEAAFITDFTKEGRSPIIYSGVDMKPDARLGVVKKGIYSDDIIKYYNEHRGAYPELNEQSYEDFKMLAATNSQASEDPYASNDPRYPGRWALPAAFDQFTGMTRYYYPDFLIGKSDWGNVAEYLAEQKPLGTATGTPVPAVIAVTSYDSRVNDPVLSPATGDGQIDSSAELQAAIDRLLSLADNERALRNFEGMREDIYDLNISEPGGRPLGGDGSYHIGSVWITPPYKTITTSVTGGKASIVLTGEVDSFRAAAGERVRFAVSTSASEVEVKVGDTVLTPVDDIYSFVMPDETVRINVALSGGGGDPGDEDAPDVYAPNGTVFKAGAAQDLALVIDKDFGLFTGFELDGKTLREKDDYKVEEGSTLITVFKSYMDTLPVGEHALIAYFSDGISVTQAFSVESDPLFSVSVDPGITGGTLSASPASAKAGELITVTVYTQAGYRLLPGSLNWDKRALNADADGKYTFRMPAWSVTLFAEFDRAETLPPAIPPGEDEDAFKEGIRGTGDINAGIWDGKSIDLRWFDPAKDSYTINTPAELAGLAALVNGLYNREIDTVAGKASYIHVNTGLGDDDGPQGNNKSTATYHYGDYNFAGKTVRLGRDIDMGESNNYMPIGGQYLMTRNRSETRIDASFNGVFDGGGHSVYIYTDRQVSTGNYGDGSSVGLIGRLGVHDNDPVSLRASGLAVKNVAVYGSVRANRSVGGVVGKIGKTVGGAVIENCANFASISSTDAKGVGGIVGAAWNGGAISNCYNAGTVNGTHPNPAGGIAGSVEIPIENSYSHGRVTAPSGYAMGIGTNNGGAPTPASSYYLADSARDGGWYTGGTADNSGVRTSEFMKSDEFVTLLGSAFVKDTNNINKGYPVLRWQGGSVVTPPQTPSDDGSRPTVNIPSTTTVRDGEAVTIVDIPEEGLALADSPSSRLVVNVDTGGESVNKITAEMPAEFMKQASESNSEIEVRSALAKVLLPEKAVAELAEAGKDVSVKAERNEAENTYTFTVESDGKALQALDGGIRAAIPVKAAEVSAGTVAVLVHADGTEEIRKKSAVVDGELLVSLAGSAVIKVEDRSKSFEDVGANAWYTEAVKFVTSRELFTGTSETEFSPNASMTRAMLVTVLYRLEDEPAAGAAAFTDVSATGYYARAVAWASDGGIVTGMGDGLFAPNADITREQLAAILYRYAGAQGLDVSARSELSSFMDAKDVSSWASEALAWAVGAGIITGRSNPVGTELAPKGTATRAEVAAMIERLIERTARI